MHSKIDEPGTALKEAHPQTKLASSPLRIGMFIEGWYVDKWIVSIVNTIQKGSYAEIAALFVTDNLPDSWKLSSCQNPSLISLSLKDMVVRLDSYLFRPEPDALERVDLRETLSLSDVSMMAPKICDHEFAFSPGDGDRIKALNLDVLLLFVVGKPSITVLSLFKYGVWHLSLYDVLAQDRFVPGFWEVLEGQPTSELILLCQMTEFESPLVLHRHVGPVDLRSIRRTINNLLWKATRFIPTMLKETHVRGLSNKQPQENGGEKQHRIRRSVTGGRTLKGLASHGARYLSDLMTYRHHVDQWVIGYRFSGPDWSQHLSPADYTWIDVSQDRFWADPFPVTVNGQKFLFFEEYVHAEGKGHLCVARLDHHGLVEEPQVVLKTDWHLSYPYVFLWEGEWYLMPEMQETGRLDLFKFTNFPDDVEYVKTVMDGVIAADATLHWHENRWWMFVCLGVKGTWNVDELHLFSADTPLGPWKAHPSNPIKSDIRSSRPAGKIISAEGKLFRPAQDCSKGYGYAIRLQEIVTMSETHYQEREVDVILPYSEGRHFGIHTLNVDGDLIVIDGKRLCSVTV